MTVDISGLPKLPDTAGLRDASAKYRTEAREFDQICQDAQADWKHIQAAIDFEGSNPTIYAAADRLPLYGEGLRLSTEACTSALEMYCDEIDSLRPRYEAAIGEASICRDPEAEDSLQKDAEAQEEVNAVARALQEIEQRCADTIKAADPGSAVPDAPNVPVPVQAGMAATQELLERLRVKEFTFTITHEVRYLKLETSRIFVTNADGTTIAATKATLVATSIKSTQTVKGRAVHLDSSLLNNKGRPPKYVRVGGKTIGALGLGLTAWDAAADRYARDQVEHPEYTDEERAASASQSVVLRTSLSGAGGAGGAIAGAAAGAAIGSVVPGAGTVIGGVIGAVVGGFLGSSAGDMAGATIDNRTRGQSLRDSWSNAWESLWG